MFNQIEKPRPGEFIAVISTSMGSIKVRLFPHAAPKAVENFMTHAKNGYYDGLIFHRVIKDFMLQGGDPTGTGCGGESIWGKPFEDEFDPDLHNLRGALSMANAGPGTNGSQFFIVQATSVSENLLAQMVSLPDHFTEAVCENYRQLGGTPWLDYKHTVFGQVYEGMDVVDAIAAVKVGSADKPIEKVTITTITVSKAE